MKNFRLKSKVYILKNSLFAIDVQLKYFFPILCEHIPVCDIATLWTNFFKIIHTHLHSNYCFNSASSLEYEMKGSVNYVKRGKGQTNIIISENAVLFYKQET